MTDDVLISVDGKVGRIRLNRPRAIHALNFAMCRAVLDALTGWRDDAGIEAVMIDHAEGRGFCAGGDIRLVAQSGSSDASDARAFFRVEYAMNLALFNFAKPIVAFMDGITMGGGVGISQPAKYRVATQNTIFAMPETGIGLFPDVGGGWFLPRLPGRTGVWLATTGGRIDGADCKAIGLATHYISSEHLEDIKAKVIADLAQLSVILAAADEKPPPSRLETQRAVIDRLFASNRYEDILAALEADGSEWAQKQLSVLATKSPQTIKVALRQLAIGATLEKFADNMRMEYRLACHVIRRPDFVEGVRALIFDKDNAPKWNPATPEAVPDDLVESFFAPPPNGREWTPLPELGG